ncbi:MAG TPA: hypothetical protein PKD85_16655, partial [Saprospiraceae bacterium]|nr:hypothetical protein [Saprospiraceae bacterium]
MIIIDRVVDNSKNRNNTVISENIKNATLLQELAIRKLENIFLNTSEFWNYWDKRRKEHYYVSFFERDLNEGKNSINWEDYCKIASNKAAFGKAAIDALYLLNNKNEDDSYTQIIKAYDYFSIGLQLYDDFKDIEDDYNDDQVNWCLIYHNKVLKKRKIENSKENLKKSFYIEGTATFIIDLSFEYFQKAKDELKSIKCDGFNLVISNLASKFQSIKFTIENHLKITKYKVTQSKILIKANATENALNIGLNYILSRQKKDGSWDEFLNQGGISNIWSTSYILAALKDFQHNLNVNYCANNALQFLANQKTNVGWSYNTTWIADCDSTS